MSQDFGTYKRQFICSCGKTYLSYAALFTHIKQKHDGKAPGPIVRPKSDRKRGRPRKNHDGEIQYSSSDPQKPQYGISKIIDNNNIEQYQQGHQKTKKAAQLLGLGGFAAFTAYKPEPMKGSPRKISQSGKKTLTKKSSICNQAGSRKGSVSYIGMQQKEQLNINSYHISCSQHEIAEFFDILQLQNKKQLRKIFVTHHKTDQLPIQLQQIEIFKKINVNFENPPKINEIQSAAINVGVSHFLKEIRDVLYEGFNHNKFITEEASKFESWNIKEQQIEEQALKYNSIYFDQILILVTFLLKYIVEQGPPQGTNQLLGMSILSIVDYIPSFIVENLPHQIKTYCLYDFDLFKDLNPVRFMLFFDNWLVIKKNKGQTFKQEVQKSIQFGTNQRFKQGHQSLSKIEKIENKSIEKEEIDQFELRQNMQLQQFQVGGQKEVKIQE